MGPAGAVRRGVVTRGCRGVGSGSLALQQGLAQPDVIALTPHQPCRRQPAVNVDDMKQAVVPGQVEVHEAEDGVGQKM